MCAEAKMMEAPLVATPLEGDLDPCLIWPKSIATSGDFFENLS